MRSSPLPPKNSIPIGPGEWIDFVDLTGRYERAIEIDSLMVELESMWAALETQCVAQCCGIDAFDFYPEALASVAGQLDLDHVCESLRELRSSIAGLGADVIVSTRLNNYADVAVFDKLLSHLQACFSKLRNEEA